MRCTLQVPVCFPASSTGAQEWIWVILLWIKYFLHDPLELQCAARAEGQHGGALESAWEWDAESRSAGALSTALWGLETFCSAGQQWRQQSAENQTSHCHREGSCLQWNQQGCISDLHETRDLNRVKGADGLGHHKLTPEPLLQGCPAIRMRFLTAERISFKLRSPPWKAGKNMKISQDKPNGQKKMYGFWQQAWLKSQTELHQTLLCHRSGRSRQGTIWRFWDEIGSEAAEEEMTAVLPQPPKGTCSTNTGKKSRWCQLRSHY